MMVRIRVFQAVTLLLAGGSALLFVHWFATRPEPIALARKDLGFFAFLIFSRETDWAGYAVYLTVVQGLLATTALAAAALSTLLAVKAADRIEARRLMLALALGAASVAYFFFVTTTPSLRTAIGWSPISPWRLPLDFLAYLAAALSPLLTARFFFGYPRAVTGDDWKAHVHRHLQSARDSVRRGDGHYRLLPASIRKKSVSDAKAGWLSGSAQVELQFRMVRLLESPAALVIVGVWALGVASLDSLDAMFSGPSSEFSRNGKVLATCLYMPFLVVTGSMAFESMKLRSAGSFADDRSKVDWISSTLLVGGLMALPVFPLTMATGLFALPYLAELGVFIPGRALMFGPSIAAVVLLSLSFLLALTLSIFYRGAVDPRLAARKVTLFSSLGLIITFLFVLLERTVAAKLVTWLGLSPDSGALLAGAAVASTFVPLRNRTEKAVNMMIGRWLPLDSMIQGERQVLAVAISDLSGYTSLSSRDEKQALLLAALLQRQAARLTQMHGGRIVKSMGDAVLFAFDDASTAATVLIALHRDFQPAAEQLGLEALPVHSGAHWGEVTVAHDGDIYGQTVNIAARIQGSAGTGQIVVSNAFAHLVRDTASISDLGRRQFRNVAEPVQCAALSSN